MVSKKIDVDLVSPLMNISNCRVHKTHMFIFALLLIMHRIVAKILKVSPVDEFQPLALRMIDNTPDN